MPSSGRKDNKVDVRYGRDARSIRSHQLLRRQNQAGWIKAGVVNVEASIWVAGCLMAILGVIKAAYSEQPLLWLAVLPSVALASTIFIFVGQGFHFRNGVLVLGRRRG